jgi:bacterioferritin
MMDQVDVVNEEFVQNLNEDLATEFQSIMQYVQHVSSIKGARFQQVVADLREHVSQEVEHAMIVAGQIAFLGGTPRYTIPSIEFEVDAVEALKEDLALEEQQLERYRHRIEEANELGLPDVAEALAPVLAQTQSHVRDLRASLGRGAN